jgi:hypothetical protein
MKTQGCPEAWKVEARRDRRLAGAEAAAFDRHAEACIECTGAIRRFEQLDAMLADLPQFEQDSLAVARGRGRLLNAADAAATGRRDAAPRRRRTFASFALVAVAITSIWLLRAGHRAASSSSPLPEPLALAPSFDVAPPAPSTAPSTQPFHPLPAFAVTIEEQRGARWVRRDRDDEVGIRLNEGTLELRVVHGLYNRRVVFMVPDGEILDLGTVFAVSVVRQKTQSVAVSEGRVAVRIKGHRTILLEAGETWTREASSRSVKRVAQGAARTSALRSSAAHELNPVPTAETPALANGRGADRSELCPARARWDAAMTDFQANRYETAADSFDLFATSCTSDRRAEDAAYLRVIALARAGQTDAARAAAQGYLDKFPGGFRRRETQRLLDGLP